MSARDAFVYEDDRGFSFVAKRGKNLSENYRGESDQTIRAQIALIDEIFVAEPNRTARSIKRSLETPKHFTVVDLAKIEVLETALAASGERTLARPVSIASTKGVPLSLLLQFGGALAGILCLASLVGWIATAVPIVNPFVALLGLVASPFFYWMGRLTR